VAACPVLTSRREGPAAGTLIMARALDAREVGRLARTLELSLSTELVAAGALDRGPPALVRPLGPERMLASTALEDLRAAPYLALRLELPRDIYQGGLAGLRYLLAAVVLAALGFGVAVTLLIERVVIRRVARLGADVAAVQLHTSGRVTVTGDDELTGLAARINEMLRALEDARALLRDALGRYVSESIATAILARPSAARLGGDRREVTVMFCDLRGYSTLSERLPPEPIVDLLNEYFGELSQLVDGEGGCVIEYMGDAILAVFGAPVALPEHAERAVRSARAMLRRMAELNQRWRESGRARLWQDVGLPEIGCGIALHSGVVVSGNIGSRTRMKHTVIGDAVNTTARVQGLGGALGAALLVTAEVRARLSPASAATCRPMGAHKVKGREQAVEVFAVDWRGEEPA
jgi:adenylate cyclase